MSPKVFTHLELGPGDYSVANFVPTDLNEMVIPAILGSTTVYCASGAPPIGLPTQYMALTSAALPSAGVFPTVKQRVDLSSSASATILGGTTVLLATQTGSLSTAVTLSLPVAAPDGFSLTITTEGTLANLHLAGATVAPASSSFSLSAYTSLRLIFDAGASTPQWVKS